MEATNQIVVLNTSIRERDGLYSLNDLHKAAGSEDRHKPKYFAANQQTQDLAAEIIKGGITPLVKMHGGRNGSQTYACRELVIAYAAWISAKFHLAVIRVFLQSQAPKAPKALPPAAHPVGAGLKEAIAGAVREVTREAMAEISPHAPALSEMQAGYLRGALESVSLHLPENQRAPWVERVFKALTNPAVNAPRYPSSAWEKSQITPLPQHVRRARILSLSLYAHVRTGDISRMTELPIECYDREQFKAGDLIEMAYRKEDNPLDAMPVSATRSYAMCRF